MSSASARPVDDPPPAGGAVPGAQAAGTRGARLLGLVQRFMRTGMAYARGINGIAREHLAGTDLARLAPAGFNPTSTHYLIVEAVSWTAALRQRLRALAGRPAPGSVPGLPKAGRTPQGCGAAFYLPEGTPETAADPWNDWQELAKPLRLGQRGVAAARRAIEGLPDREVFSNICDKLKRGAVCLGSEADVERIAALEAAALALCPEADAPEGDKEADGPAGGKEADAPAGDKEADAPEGDKTESCRAEDAPRARAAGPPSDEPESEDEPESGVDDDPPQKPPDG